MSQQTENIGPKLLKVWYDPDRKWFMVFTPEGNEIGGQRNITISDDINSKKILATINTYVDVVNEPPMPDAKICETKLTEEIENITTKSLELMIKKLKGLF